MSTEKVSVTRGFTVPGSTQFSSRRGDYFYETVVREGETVEQAFARAAAVVDKQIALEAAESTALPPPSDRPAAGPAVFRGLPAQRQEAQARLDELGVRSPGWRNAFVDRAVELGVLMDELGDFFQGEFRARLDAQMKRGDAPWKRKPSRSYGGGYGHYRS